MKDINYNSILSRFCLVSLILLISFTNHVWGEECYVYTDTETTHELKTKDADQLIFETDVFTNTDGIDSLWFTYNTWNLGPSISVYYSTDGGSNYKWLDDKSDNNGDRNVGNSLTKEQRSANRFKFVTKGGGGWWVARTIDVKNIYIRKAPTLKLNISSYEFSQTAVDATVSQTFTVSTYNVGAATPIVSKSGTNASYFDYSLSEGSSDCPKTYTLTISYTPGAETTGDSKHTASFQVLVANKDTADLTVYGTAQSTATPEYTWNGAASYLVGDASLDLSTLWTSSSSASKTYTKLSFTPSGSNNSGATEPALEGATLSLGQAGTVRLRLSQPATTGYYAGADTIDVVINKYTPVFTWNTGNTPFYFKSDIADIFSSSNTDFGYTSFSSNTNVAEMEGSTLHVYNVDESDCKITMSQAESYYWNSKDSTFAVVPINRANKLPLTFTNANSATYTYETVTPDNKVEWDGDQIKLVGRGTKYLILHFEGTPDMLYYRFREQAIKGDGTTWYVIEGATLETLTDTISREDRPSSEWPDAPREIQLSPSTRYVKLCYTGNRDAQYKDIQITELNKFDADEETIDFGLQGQNYGTQIKTVNFDHANAGRITTVEIIGDDKDYFEVTPTRILGTGREQYGSATLRVSFDNKTAVRGENEPYTAQLRISDNNGHTETVNLTGRRHGKNIPEFTFNPDKLPYYLGSTIATPAVSTNTQTALVITSLDPTIADIVDGKLVIGETVDSVHIQVSQPETADYRSSSKIYAFKTRVTPPLFVPLMLTEAIYTSTSVDAEEDCAWDNGYIRVGRGDIDMLASGRYWDNRKSFVIEFGGSPDKLSFQLKNTFCAIRCKWKIEESTDSVNWTTVWSENRAYKFLKAIPDIQLSPTTQFLRFSYGGNYAGYFKDINITATEGTKYLVSPIDKRYVSRGADWGTHAVVDEFGIPMRVTRYTDDNTNIYMLAQFMDNRTNLFEDSHEEGTNGSVYTDASKIGEREWVWTNVDGEIIISRPDGAYLYVTDNGKLELTKTAASATKWEIEDYTIHDARIMDKLNHKAATAAEADFGSDINTMEKVRTKLRTEEFDSTVVVLEPRPICEVKGVYRDSVNQTVGTLPIFDTVISGLDTGFYCLTVQAFYRSALAPYDWENHVKGTECNPAYTYANDFKFPIKSVYDVTGRHSVLQPGDTLCADGYYYPGNLAAATKAFEDPNTYLHDLYVYVHADEGETTGTLRYGIKNPSYIKDTWLVYGNFTLTKIARKEFIFNAGEGTNVWATAGNWLYKGVKSSATPNEHNAVVIQSNVEVAGEFAVYRMRIDGEYKVTIKPEGGLTVGAGGIKNATKDNLKLAAATSGTHEGKTGYLRISPYYTGAMPQATVELFSKGYYDRSGTGDNVAAWQCVGAPISDAGIAAKSVYTQSWIYSWVESADDWVNNRRDLQFTPFTGYITTQYKNTAGMKLTYEGTLVSGADVREIPLTYSGEGKGHNLLANSYAAPIDISKFSTADFHNATPTIFIENAGTHEESSHQMEGTTAEKAAAPGQILAVPVTSAADLASSFNYPISIPSMQGFWVDATGEDATVTLDYSRLVWGAAHGNAPMRAPKRTQEEQPLTGSLQMMLAANGWYDNVFMLESKRYDAAYEPGSDAYKKAKGNLNIYVVLDNEQQLAVNATNSIKGTRVGVRTGEEVNYLITFSHVMTEQDLELYDHETGIKTLINEGTEYSFSAEPNTLIDNRFEIIAREEAPGVATGAEKANNEMKVHKFIKDNQLFILKNGVLYDTMGHRVR